MSDAGGVPSTTLAPAPAAIPLTQASRDQAVELLTQHFANDGIGLEEFERRTSAVFAARTADELHALVADVAAARATALTVIPEHGRISAILSSNEQRGQMIVPRYLEIVSVLGNAEIDLRDATFGEGITVIEVRTVLGNVELTLPADARVEMAGETILGSFVSQVSPPADLAATRVIRITGRAILGNVEAASAAPRLPPSVAAAALAPR